MKIRYTPFSERMVIDQPVKGLDFANDMIQMYFMMSLRYREYRLFYELSGGQSAFLFCSWYAFLQGQWFSD